MVGSSASAGAGRCCSAGLLAGGGGGGIAASTGLAAPVAGGGGGAASGCRRRAQARCRRGRRPAAARRCRDRRRRARRPPRPGSRPDEGEILGQRRRNPRHLLLARGAGDADARCGSAFLPPSDRGCGFPSATPARTGCGRCHCRKSTDESAAEYITSVPFGAITGARPAEKLRNRRSNGLRLEASISAILTPAPRLLISPSTVSRLKPSRRTSGSVQIWRIDRDHVALAARLHAKAGEEDQRDRARLDLAVQALEGAAHLLAGQVLADIDIETVALELFGDVARVVDRLLQRRLGVRIFRVADDQRIALAGCERRGYRRDRKINVRSNARRIFIMTAVQITAVQPK